MRARLIAPTADVFEIVYSLSVSVFFCGCRRLSSTTFLLILQYLRFASTYTNPFIRAQHAASRSNEIFERVATESLRHILKQIIQVMDGIHALYRRYYVDPSAKFTSFIAFKQRHYNRSHAFENIYNCGSIQFIAFKCIVYSSSDNVYY